MIKKVLVIDIGGTNIKYAIMTKDADMLSSSKIPTPDSLEAFLESLYGLVDTYRQEIEAVAISVPGKVDTLSRTVYFGGSLTYLDGLNFKTALGDKYQLPVAVQNDAKSAALAELWLGNLKNVKDGAVITLGTGVGGGIVLDGKLRLGSHFQAGELSMSILDADRPGMVKTVGYLGSAVRMISQVNEAVGEKDLSDGIKAFELINKKDQRVYPIFEDYCRSIAYLILNLQAYYDLTTYAIGGGISSQPILIEEIKHQLQAFIDESPILKLNFPEIAIVKAQFENDSNLYGALYQLLQD